MKYIDFNILLDILEEISNKTFTEKSFASKMNYTERSIRRYIKILKDAKIIYKDQNREWVINVLK